MRIALILLLIAGNALATDRKPPKPPPPVSMSNSQSAAHSDSHSASNAASESISQSDSASSATVGNISNQGSPVSIGDLGSDTIITYEDNNEPAPSVTVFVPPSNAPFMKCIGVGGSNQDGSATGAWCWIQRDAFGRDVFAELADMNLPEAAAEARCSTKLLWRPFGSKEDCIATMTQVVIARHAAPEVAPEPGKLLAAVEYQEEHKEDVAKLEQQIATLKTSLYRERTARKKVEEEVQVIRERDELEDVRAKLRTIQRVKSDG